MKGPKDLRPPMESVRARATRRARQRYPAGKALGRIEYFETQRGLPRTREEAGLVIAPEGPGARARIARRPASRRTSGARSDYSKASAVKARLAPTFAAAASVPVWRAVGPSVIPNGQTYGSARPPVSGRCNGLVVSPTDPRHLVLSSGGGGLWGSFDQGTTWLPLTDAQPTTSMGAIAAAPGAPNIVYAGTGEGDNESTLGVGLLRSSDGGQTWQFMPAVALSGTGVFDIEVDPADPMHVWVGTMKNLLESKNGGATWRVVQPVTTWDVSINPDDPLEVFAATRAGLIRSTNGGSTWALVSLPGVPSTSRFNRLEVCHAPSRPAVVYAAGVVDDGRGVLFRRATGGGAFSSETTPNLKRDSDIAQAWYDWCFAVSPVDPDLVYLGAVELYRGRRAGGTWTWGNISSRASGDSIHPDQHHLVFDPSDPSVLYACNDGGLFRSHNGGSNWTSLNRGLNITEFEFLAHMEGQDSWIIGGTQDNGTLAHQSLGTWKQIALGDGGDCGADEAQNFCYHSYYGMWIERAPATGLGAFRWKDVSPPFADDYDALFYPPMDVRGPVVAKAGITVFVSGDSGDHWAEVDCGFSGNASALLIHDTSTIFAASEEGELVRIKKSSGSAGWAAATVTTLVSPRAAFLSDIVVPGAANGTIWVSSSAFGGGHLFRSTNGGAAWEDRSGNLPDIPVNAFIVDPKNTRRLFAATDHGVYRSSNSGTTWIDYSNGLPNVVVGDLILHERLRVLRAGTRNRGAWEVQV